MIATAAGILLGIAVLLVVAWAHPAGLLPTYCEPGRGATARALPPWQVDRRPPPC